MQTREEREGLRDGTSGNRNLGDWGVCDKVEGDPRQTEDFVRRTVAVGNLCGHRDERVPGWDSPWEY